MNEQITNKFTEIMVDTNDPLLFFGIILISLMVFAAIYYLLNSNTFKPGSQYKYIVKNFKGSYKKKPLNTKQVTKLELKRLANAEKDMTLSRLRWGMNTKELNKKQIFEMQTGMIIGIPLTVIGMLLFKGPLSLLFSAMGLATVITGVARTTLKFSKDKKELDKDILNDLSRMVSLYKFSDVSRGFYGLVQDYLPTSNALKKDLEYYISDLNSFGEEEALDRLGERVKIPQMFKLITHIKSSGTASRAQFEANLQILDREITEDLKEMYRKESQKKFRAAIINVLPVFGFAMVVFIITQVVDIQSAITGNSLM